METWKPRSEDELRRAAVDGRLEESLRIEFKEMLPKNDDVAKTLAALAFHGGTLIVGVTDSSSRDPDERLRPHVLDGCAEKVTNLARDLVDPPLWIDPHEVASAADPTVGYLVVDVRQSPLRPHVVRGRHWWRTGKANSAMTWEQVRLVHLEAKALASNHDDAVAYWRSRTPLIGSDSSGRPFGAMRLVAVPTSPPGPRMGLSAWGDSWREWITGQMSACWDPSTLTAFGAWEFDVQRGGIGLVTEYNRLRFGEDGSIAALLGRIAAEHGGYRRLLDNDMLLELRRLVQLVGTAGTAMNYSGTWVIHVEFDGLDQVTLHSEGHNFKVLDEDRSTGQVTAYSDDLLKRPGHWTEELSGELYRWASGRLRGADQAYE